MSIVKRSLVHFSASRNWIRRLIFLGSLVTTIGSSGSYALAHNPPIDVNLSGYETFIGIRCTLHGQPATCGVTFSGWIGGEGQVPDGWEPFPGDFQGLWKTQVSYTGQEDLGTPS